MTSKEIKIEFIKQDISQKSVAQKIGVTEGCLSQVISRYRRTHWIRKAIAEALGRPYEEVWGESLASARDRSTGLTGKAA